MFVGVLLPCSLSSYLILPFIFLGVGRVGMYGCEGLEYLTINTCSSAAFADGYCQIQAFDGLFKSSWVSPVKPLP